MRKLLVLLVVGSLCSCNYEKSEITDAVKRYLLGHAAQPGKSAAAALDTFEIIRTERVAAREALSQARDYYTKDMADFAHKAKIDSNELARMQLIYHDNIYYFTTHPRANKEDTDIMNELRKGYVNSLRYAGSSKQARDSVDAVYNKADTTPKDCYRAYVHYVLATASGKVNETTWIYLDRNYKVTGMN